MTAADKLRDVAVAAVAVVQKPEFRRRLAHARGSREEIALARAVDAMLALAAEKSPEVEIVSYSTPHIPRDKLVPLHLDEGVGEGANSSPPVVPRTWKLFERSEAREPPCTAVLRALNGSCGRPPIAKSGADTRCPACLEREP